MFGNPPRRTVNLCWTAGYFGPVEDEKEISISVEGLGCRQSTTLDPSTCVDGWLFGAHDDETRSILLEGRRRRTETRVCLSGNLCGGMLRK
jgi:hypothetical protein